MSTEYRICTNSPSGPIGYPSTLDAAVGWMDFLRDAGVECHIETREITDWITPEGPLDGPDFDPSIGPIDATIYCGESIRWRLEPADLQPTGGWLLMRPAAPMLKAECQLADGHDGLHEWLSDNGETEIRWRVER